MSSISRYVLCDRDGYEDDYEYENFREAREAADKADSAVLEREYIYSDTSLVYTPDGSDVWAPAGADENAETYHK